MKTTRRQQIEAMLSVEPDDSFLRYALALELKAENSLPEAIFILRQLLNDEGKYTAAYYQLAEMLANVGDFNEALEVIERGLKATEISKEKHAHAELLGLKENIIDIIE